MQINLISINLISLISLRLVPEGGICTLEEISIKEKNNYKSKEKRFFKMQRHTSCGRRRIR